MLVIHAGGDRIVPVEHARALAEAAGGELWVTRTAAHLGSYAAEQVAYAARVIAFFTQSLAAAPARQDTSRREPLAALATLAGCGAPPMRSAKARS